MTNLTFTVKGGPKRELKDGQTLRKDGMLLSADGSLVPVVDHIAMLRGQPYVVVNGVASPVTTEKVLANGSRVLPNGTVFDEKGRKTRLIDGQLIKLQGGKIAAVDTVTLRDGKVVIQSQGSKIELAPRRTFMMNDGTKVFGNGTLKYSDGRTKELKDGETVEVTGVQRSGN